MATLEHALFDLVFQSLDDLSALLDSCAPEPLGEEHAGGETETPATSNAEQDTKQDSNENGETTTDGETADSTTTTTTTTMTDDDHPPAPSPSPPPAVPSAPLAISNGELLSKLVPIRQAFHAILNAQHNDVFDRKLRFNIEQLKLDVATTPAVAVLTAGGAGGDEDGVSLATTPPPLTSIHSGITAQQRYTALRHEVDRRVEFYQAVLYEQYSYLRESKQQQELHPLRTLDVPAQVIAETEFLQQMYPGKSGEDVRAMLLQQHHQRVQEVVAADHTSQQEHQLQKEGVTNETSGESLGAASLSELIALTHLQHVRGQQQSDSGNGTTPTTTSSTSTEFGLHDELADYLLLEERIKYDMASRKALLDTYSKTCSYRDMLASICAENERIEQEISANLTATHAHIQETLQTISRQFYARKRIPGIASLDHDNEIVTLLSDPAHGAGSGV